MTKADETFLLDLADRLISQGLSYLTTRQDGLRLKEIVEEERERRLDHFGRQE